MRCSHVAGLAAFLILASSHLTYAQEAMPEGLRADAGSPEEPTSDQANPSQVAAPQKDGTQASAPPASVPQAIAPEAAAPMADEPKGAKELLKLGPKFTLSTSLNVTTTPIQVDAVNIDIPPGTLLETLDIEAEIADGLELSSTSFLLSGSYFPLPFLELSAHVGLISSETSADITASGTFPDGTLFAGQQIDVDLARDLENDGVSYGVGTSAYIPLTRIKKKPLILRSGFYYTRSDLGEVESDTIVWNLALVNAQRFWDRDLTLALGASYIQINRDVTLVTEFAGINTGVALEQSIENPWAGTGTLLIPLTGSLAASVTASNNFNGLQSYSFRLTYRK